MRSILFLFSVLLPFLTAVHSAEAKMPAPSRITFETYRMKSSNEVVLYLAGTTPIKDWKMTAHGLLGDAKFTFGSDHQIVSVDALNFTLPVHNLKGDAAPMEQSAYRSLKADRYTNITFTLSSATIEPRAIENEANPGLCIVQALGTLQVAGVARAVTLTMQSERRADGSIVFTGTQTLRMSDYNVERPSVLFGAIKAGDTMTLSYNLIFTR